MSENPIDAGPDRVMFYALVFFVSTGWHVIVADSQALGEGGR